MPHDDQLFTPEEVDEQIDWLERAARAQPPTPHTTTNIRVIQGLHRLYDNEQTDAQSVDAVWQRLLERGAVPAQQPQRARRSGPPRRQHDSGPPPTYPPAAPARRGLSTRLLAIAAAALLVVVISGLVAGIILVRQHNPVVSNQPTAKPGQTAQATQKPATQEIAYIGSDGNVWEMTWPGGTPKQLTTDAKSGLHYTGLTWSPDGSMLAVGQGSNRAYVDTLVILTPDGTVVAKEPLDRGAYNRPFVWSPDSQFIAYRAGSSGVSPSGNLIGKLVIANAHTGKTEKTLNYDGGPSGCGGAGPRPALYEVLREVGHVSYEYGAWLDTFAWSNDQNTIAVDYDCGSGEAAQVNLSTGATSTPYPLDASYQPEGNLVLGLWHDGTLGLTDLSANHVRVLVNPQPYNPSYMVSLGQSAWTSDGQAIYYEYDDSIWRISVDASNPHQVVAGTALDSQQNATVQLAPSPSPDGRMLLYLQATGSNRNVDPTDPTPEPTPTIPLTTQWYVAQADGSNPQPLPQGISEAVWRPGN